MIRFLDIIEVLGRHRVDFIVVGGVAAVLEGAPVSTFDLDILPRRTADNHRRLLAALTELDATYRDPAGRHIAPDLDKLTSFRLHRLSTTAGFLDLLTEIEPGLTFDDLIDETIRYEIADTTVRVLRLEVVIRSKECAGRDKDLASLPVLRRTLELKSSG